MVSKKCDVVCGRLLHPEGLLAVRIDKFASLNLCVFSLTVCKLSVLVVTTTYVDKVKISGGGPPESEGGGGGG
jgi:hypothetical protein